MKQFQALVCASKNNISLPLLAAYLDEHTLPAEIGELTLSSLVAHEYIAEDPEHPSYYFCTEPHATPRLTKGVRVHLRLHGLLINLLATGGPGATL